jgi:hypothetical protein
MEGLMQDEVIEAVGVPHATRFPGRLHHDTLYEAGKREVDLYVRTYNTLLRSSGPIAVDVLIPAHLNIESLLHAGAPEPAPDMGAFMYSSLRLPPEILRVRVVAMSQSERIFRRGGYVDVESWTAVSAPGRRRKWHFDGKDTLAVYVASTSDLDDLIPTIVAWQIEWNKLHRIFRAEPDLRDLALGAPGEEQLKEIRDRLGIDQSDWERLQAAWAERFLENLQRLATHRQDLKLHMLGGTYLGYSRATDRWWAPVNRVIHQLGLAGRPTYFVSSNTHSIVNILSGVARRRRERLIAYVESGGLPELVPELHKLQTGDIEASWDNFLYYAVRYFYRDYPEERAVRDREEAERGLVSLQPESVIDVGMQVIDLAKVRSEDLDPRIQRDEGGWPQSNAVIININYPLGMAAYHIMTRVAQTVDDLRGVYILGKAATLNARIGDVMISDVVYDEHSENTYWFNNAFSSASLEPYLVYGSALDNQRAITVRGTYLQNRGHLDFYYRENYTVAEMEAGPYLSGIYEEAYMTRYPIGEQINLSDTPIDLGVIHYASDTPYTRAQTLGARGLSYYGMDSTYAATLAIVRRVLELASKHG